MAFAAVGAHFVYGYLVDHTPFNLDIYENKSGIAYNVMEEINNGIVVGDTLQQPLKGIFVFKFLSVIFFFSFMVSMLFHLGVMQCKNIFHCLLYYLLYDYIRMIFIYDPYINICI